MDMTTSQKLPITEMIKNEMIQLSGRDDIIGESQYSILSELLGEINDMEEQQLTQAKEEARKDIVGVLEEMIEEHSKADEYEAFASYGRVALQEALERFQNNTSDNQ